MNVGEQKLAVKRLFGDTAGVQITDDDILRWLNDAQIDLIRKTDFFLNVTSIPSIVGTDTYAVPTLDFLRLSRVTYNGSDLEFITYQQLNQWYPNRDVTPISTGTPKVFTFFNRNLILYPAPDTIYNISLTYIARPNVLLSDAQTSQLPVEIHEDMVRFALTRAYELDANEPAIVRASSEYQARVSQGRADIDFPLSEIYPSIRDVSGD